MNTGRGPTKISWGRLLALTATVALTACAGRRVAAVRDGELVMPGYYHVPSPVGWRALQNLDRDTLTFTQMVADAQFVRCPQAEVMTVGRAAYKQKAAATGPTGDRELVEMATGLLEEVYSARRNAPPRTNVASEVVSIAGHRIARVSFETLILGGSFCDPVRPLGAVTERYYFIDAGRRGMGLSLNSGVWSQKFVFIHFEGPSGAFASDVSEAERLAAGLEFIERP